LARLFNDQLTVEIARFLGCDCLAAGQREERRDALHYRLFKAFLRGSFEGTLSARRVKMVDADCISRSLRKSRARGSWTRQLSNRRTRIGLLSSIQPRRFSPFPIILTVRAVSSKPRFPPALASIL
jgi:hypothetical protein